MTIPRLLAAFSAFALFCTIAGASPTLKLGRDRSDAELAPKQWFDLILRVDPGGDPIQAEGLTVTPAAAEGVLFGEAILPAPDADGTYRKPFAVRVPARIDPIGTAELKLTLNGKTGAGAPLALETTGKMRVSKFTRRHVQATASLKKPALAGEENAVVVKGTVIAGYHVYGRDEEYGLPLVGELLPAPGTRGAPPWTGGGQANMAGEKYYDEFTLEIPFTPTRAGKVAARVAIEWSACTEVGCDPNEFLYVPVAFDVGGTSVEEVPGAVTADTSSAAEEGGLATAGLLELVLLAIGAGIFALLMPCTYPLIPITISFFSKQAEIRHRSVLPLALAYGAGIVGIFSLIGLIVGVGFAQADTLYDIATGTAVNIVFAALFLVFGLSLIGLFEIRLPSWFDNLAAKASGTGGYLSVFAMGTTLVITSFTCTAPFVGGLLVFAAKGGDWQRVTFAMAVFGLTMGIPFVLLSLFPKFMQRLPRSGEWMKRLKVTLGIIELGLVLKFLSMVDIDQGLFLVNRELFLVLWGASWLIAALYVLGAFDLFRKGASWSLTKGRAIAGLVLSGIVAMCAVGANGTNLADHLGKVGEGFEAFLPNFEGKWSVGFLASVDDYEEGVRLAREKGAPIFLHFTGYS